jgi:hypothetical protein
MSGIKSNAWAEFLRMTNISDLAMRARVGRSHLTQVMQGQRRGRNTWKHVLPLLTDAQVFQLKQCATWNPELETMWKETKAARELGMERVA